MEEAIEHFTMGLPNLGLGVLIVVCLGVLGKSADWLVDHAVTLSLRWNVPKAIVGATIVSLGTTTPEAAISVLAAIKGSPGLALGNAVGSIICDTGLILGIAILIQPMRLDPAVVNRQGWVQLGAGILLILSCLPYGNFGTALTAGGVMPQVMGYVFLILLFIYLWQSIRWAKAPPTEQMTEAPVNATVSENLITTVLLLGSIALVVFSSSVLIPAVKVAAVRMSIPEGIIAATLVAFGTSLPELVTVVTAARRGHGELGIGNVIGADILNVLFVAGASAAVTKEGLHASPQFFKVLFPSMLFVLVIFRIGIFLSGRKMKRPFGVILLGSYIAATLFSYAV